MIALLSRQSDRFLITLNFVAIAALLVMAACTQQQLQSFETAGPTYQQKIAAACAVAMSLAPAAGPMAPWIIGGCASEAAIAKLALDPNSLVWVNGLINKVPHG